MRIAFLPIVCALCTLATTQTPSLKAVRASHAPKIDGTLTDAAWADAPVAGPFFDPFSGKQTANATDARALLDSEARYVSFPCSDSVPSGMVSREVQPGSEFEAGELETYMLSDAENFAHRTRHPTQTRADRRVR